MNNWEISIWIINATIWAVSSYLDDNIFLTMAQLCLVISLIFELIENKRRKTR